MLNGSDVRISNFRVWKSYLSNDELKSHAKDFTSIGVLGSYKNPGLFQATTGSLNYIPKIDTLALNWNFETVTGSDEAGRFLNYDISSGSQGMSNYMWHSNSLGWRHGGKGYNFAESSTKVVDNCKQNNY